ncbi:gamma-glutamyltransferase [soil metagenome]
MRFASFTYLAPPLVSVALLFGCLPAQAPPKPRAHLAVATDHEAATQAAVTVMSQGGNALDGAIAAALVLGVVSPAASGIGGGGFALVWSERDKKLVALDFREIAPLGISAEASVARKTKGVAVGIPGEPAGLFWLSTHGAKLSLAVDAAPAIALARNGFAVGQHLSDAITKLHGLWEGTLLAPELSPFGTTPAGQQWHRVALAHTLDRFAVEGKEPFYSGDIGEKIRVAAVGDGSSMTIADLAGYQVRERTALSRTFGKRTVSTMPAPSAGGLMLLEHLVMWGADGRSSLHAFGFGTSAYDHAIAETMRGAIADRARFAGDPAFEVDVGKSYDRLLDDTHLAARRRAMLPDRTRPGVEFKSVEDGTSHLVVVDSDGNVVSLTTTVNSPFGARILVGDTGIWLNDELNDFSVPDDVAGYGTSGLGPNPPRGGARPVSSMTPTIVFENGEPILAVGGSGGRRIATAVTQATLCRLVFDADPTACVSAPRIYTNGTTLFVDPEVPESTRADLTAAGETIVTETMLGSGVQMIAIDRSSSTMTFRAAADPRKLGVAFAR